MGIHQPLPERGERQKLPVQRREARRRPQIDPALGPALPLAPRRRPRVLARDFFEGGATGGETLGRRREAKAQIKIQRLGPGLDRRVLVHLPGKVHRPPAAPVARGASHRLPPLAPAALGPTAIAPAAGRTPGVASLVSLVSCGGGGGGGGIGVLCEHVRRLGGGGHERVKAGQRRAQVEGARLFLGTRGRVSRGAPACRP